MEKKRKGAADDTVNRHYTGSPKTTIFHTVLHNGRWQFFFGHPVQL